MRSLFEYFGQKVSPPTNHSEDAQKTVGSTINDSAVKINSRNIYEETQEDFEVKSKRHLLMNSPSKGCSTVKKLVMDRSIKRGN